MTEDLVGYFERHLDELMADLKGCVERESPSGDKTAADRCGEYLAELFRREGFQVERLAQREVGDCIVARMGSGLRGTLCVGHYDTVFPIGFLQDCNPFRIEDGKAYGPGILDMKGGILMGLYAVKALRELGQLPEKRITFFLNSDEESGSFHSSERILEEARRHDNVIVLEPGYDERGSMKRFRYGRATYEIIAHGRAAHSGTNPEDAISPLEELSHQLLRLLELNDPEGGVSVAPTFLHGGIPGTCVVPESASLGVDIRVRGVERLEAIHRYVAALPPFLPGIRLEVRGGVDKPPLPVYPELIAMAEGFARELGFPLLPKDCKGGSDGNFTGGAGIPTIDGVGMSGRYLHTRDEYINVGDIPRRTALAALLLKNL